ncbi:MAG: PQQ-binding-like beta-propeller repeat protein, partial [Candidatus Acidiferrales bacterium]
MTPMATQSVYHAPQTPWYFSTLVVVLAMVLLPPVGLVLLWMRPGKPGAGLGRTIAGFTGKLALSALLVILTLIYLVNLGILHMEMSGAGWKPIFSFRDPKSDQDALEQHRAQQAASAPPAAAPATPPANDSSASAATPDTSGAAAAANAAATGVAASAASIPRAYWTDFRGPNRDGIYTETPLITSWPAGGLKPLWRQPVGGGYSSFVAAGGTAYTIEQRRDNEVVAAYDIRSGRERWTHGWPAFFQESMGGDGPRATPTWDNGKLYALGATGEFRCLDATTGKVLWQKNILSDNGASNIMWGMANSPLVVDDKVIVTPGGSNGRSVVAYNKLTGERIWGALDDHAAYTSPMVVQLLGERQLIVVTAARMAGLRVETGELLWDFPWTTMYEINSAQPIVVDHEHVFISAGYDHGAALVKIAKSDSGYSATPVWENRNMKNRFNSSVLHEGYIYGFDEAIFACIDARTGERKWKGGRYGYGQVLLVPASSGSASGRSAVSESASSGSGSAPAARAVSGPANLIVIT